MARPTRLIRAFPRPEAGGVDYDNSGSGLTADTLQEAIDELAATAGGISVDDGTTTVDPTTTLTFDPDFFDVTAPGGDVAEVTFIGTGGDLPRGFIGAKVYNAATQVINNTVAALTFDSEEYDTDGFHSGGSPTRLTIPAGMGGKYLLQGGSYANGSSADWFGFRKNGSGTTVPDIRGLQQVGSTYRTMSVVADLAAGDYVEFVGGTSSSITFGHASSSFAQTWASLIKLDSGKAGTAIGAKAVKGSDQELADSVDEAIEFGGTDQFDTDGFHDPSSSNTRMTIPAGLGGKYLVTATTWWEANSTGRRMHYFRKGGSTTLVGGESFVSATNAGQARTTSSTIFDLAAGEYIELMGIQSSGGNLDCLTDSTFSVMRLDSGSGNPTYVDWTPTLTADGGNPNLGSTGTATGRYTRTGAMVHAYGRIVFAGSGVNAGSGVYEIALPVPAASFNTTVYGSAVLYDDSGGLFNIAAVYGLDANECRIAVAGTGLQAGNGTPWAWAANDVIVVELTYEAA